VAKLVFGLAAVLHLDPAFVFDRVYALVQATGTKAQLLGYLSLGDIGVVLQHAQDPEIGVLLQLGVAASHWGVGFEHGTEVPNDDRRRSWFVRIR
jgi:hypothetical protein